MDPDIALTLPFPRFTRLKKKKNSFSLGEKKRNIFHHKYNLESAPVGSKAKVTRGEGKNS